MSNCRLLVTIDVERDYIDGWQTPDYLKFSGVFFAIPRLLDPLFDRYSISPVYFLSPEIILDRKCVHFFRNQSKCELAAHLHGEYLIPEIKSWDFTSPDFSVLDMLSDYSPQTERQKIAIYTNIFLQQFGFTPHSFRAGRFGVSTHTGKFLLELGYLIDSSVTPGIRWTDKNGKRRPDFRNQTSKPYYVHLDGNIWHHGSSPLLEVPLTIYGSEISPTWFRPTYSSVTQMLNIVQNALDNSSAETKPLPLVMMFHNVELIPGASPYSKNQLDVRDFVGKMEAVFDYCSRHGIISQTLTDFYYEYEKK